MLRLAHRFCLRSRVRGVTAMPENVIRKRVHATCRMVMSVLNQIRRRELMQDRASHNMIAVMARILGVYLRENRWC